MRLTINMQTQSLGQNLAPTSRHGPQSDHWRDAALLEYNTLIENRTWETVNLPEGQKAIGSGWVFKVKHNQDGSIERFKARLVAKGYSQRPGLDYNESFAPTFQPATLCIIMALAAVEDLELCSVDITSAKQPEGFHIGSSSKVCRLRKSLYGLKQSARQWNKKLHSVVIELGFKRIVGVAVERNRSTRTLKLHQHQFILDLLEKYAMSDCKPVQTPLPPKQVLSHSMSPSTQEEKDIMSEVPY